MAPWHLGSDKIDNEKVTKMQCLHFIAIPFSKILVVEPMSCHGVMLTSGTQWANEKIIGKYPPFSRLIIHTHVRKTLRSWVVKTCIFLCLVKEFPYLFKSSIFVPAQPLNCACNDVSVKYQPRKLYANFPLNLAHLPTLHYWVLHHYQFLRLSQDLEAQLVRLKNMKRRFNSRQKSF